MDADIKEKAIELWFRHGPFAVLSAILLAVLMGWLPSLLERNLEQLQTEVSTIQRIQEDQQEVSTVQRTSTQSELDDTKHLMRLICAHTAKNPQEEEECTNAR